jgi:hypothetical protein
MAAQTNPLVSHATTRDFFEGRPSRASMSFEFMLQDSVKPEDKTDEEEYTKGVVFR